MTLIKNTDLLKANSSYKTMIENSKSSMEKLSNQLATFLIESKKQLKGEGFNSVRDALELFQLAINQQIKIYDILLNNIQSANNDMINYMGEYDILDTKNIAELKASYAKAEQWYNYYSQDVKKLDQVNSNDGIVAPRDPSKATTYHNLMIELRKLIAALEGLSNADQSASGKLAGIVNDINRQNSAIAHLNFSFQSN